MSCSRPDGPQSDNTIILKNPYHTDFVLLCFSLAGQRFTINGLVYDHQTRTCVQMRSYACVRYACICIHMLACVCASAFMRTYACACVRVVCGVGVAPWRGETRGGSEQRVCTPHSISRSSDIGTDPHLNKAQGCTTTMKTIHCSTTDVSCISSIL
jgi:hypothetical protein